MQCPACSASFPVTATVRGIAVCPSCHRTIVASTGQLARAEDTTALSDDELTALRKLRSEARRRPA